MKVDINMFWFLTFHAKLLWVENHCVLGLTKYMDLLMFLMELNILHCLVLEDMIQFMVEPDIL